MKNKTVLLIEDDRFLLKIYSNRLKLKKYDVFMASEGEEGIRMALDKKPDIILLDIMLPKMDGFEVLEQLKDNVKTKKIPVIILSNLSQKKDKETADLLGAVDFLVKTDVSLDTIIDKVNQYVLKTKVRKKK